MNQSTFPLQLMTYLPRWATERLRKSGEQDSAGAGGAGRRRKQRPECRLLFVVTAGWRAGDDSQGGGLGPGRYPLRGLPKLSGTEMGLAQVSDPSDPPHPTPHVFLLGEGVKRERGGRDSEIFHPLGFSFSVSTSPKHQIREGRGVRLRRAAGEGRRGQPAGVLWCLEPRPGALGPREARRAGAVR